MLAAELELQQKMKVSEFTEELSLMVLLFDPLISEYCNQLCHIIHY